MSAHHKAANGLSPLVPAALEPVGDCDIRSLFVRWFQTTLNKGKTVTIADVAPTRVAPQRYVDDFAPIKTNGLVSRVPPLPARYQILSEIGSGGMGLVYKVHDLESDEIIALKVLKPEIAPDPTMREKLRQEVCLARKVTHKNVCRIHEFNRSNGTACVSMEYVEGETLFTKLHRGGALSVREAINIGRQICAGLREAHAKGIVHRDLKPANIMIDQSGHVKIMDFGIARLTQETPHVTQTIVGTPEYMSPEQVSLKAVTHRTDIYSLGLVLYEMLTGSRAFSGESAIAVAIQHVSAAPKRPSKRVPSLGPRIDAVVLKCLHKDPAKRFQSVDELDAALALSAKSPAPTTKFEMEPLLNDSLQKARAAGACLREHVRCAAFDFNRAAQPLVEKCAQFFRSQQFITPARIRSAQVAGILGLTFMSTAVTFGLVIAKHGDPGRLNATSRPMRVASNLMSSTDQPTLVMIKPEALFADQSADSQSDELSSSESEPAVAISPSRRISAVMTKKAKAHPEVSIKPSQATDLSTAALPLPPNSTYPEIALVNAEPVDSLAATVPDVPPTGHAQPAIAPSYLEVGSFKDAKWADSAVDQLDSLGFHAICIHKSPPLDAVLPRTSGSVSECKGHRGS